MKTNKKVEQIAQLFFNTNREYEPHNLNVDITDIYEIRYFFSYKAPIAYVLKRKGQKDILIIEPMDGWSNTTKGHIQALLNANPGLDVIELPVHLALQPEFANVKRGCGGLHLTVALGAMEVLNTLDTITTVSMRNANGRNKFLQQYNTVLTLRNAGIIILNQPVLDYINAHYELVSACDGTRHGKRYSQRQLLPRDTEFYEMQMDVLRQPCANDVLIVDKLAHVVDDFFHNIKDVPVWIVLAATAFKRLLAKCWDVGEYKITPALWAAICRNRCKCVEDHNLPLSVCTEYDYVVPSVYGACWDDYFEPKADVYLTVTGSTFKCGAVPVTDARKALALWKQNKLRKGDDIARYSVRLAAKDCVKAGCSTICTDNIQWLYEQLIETTPAAYKRLVGEWDGTLRKALAAFKSDIEKLDNAAEQ